MIIEIDRFCGSLMLYLNGPISLGCLQCFSPPGFGLNALAVVCGGGAISG